MQLLIKGPDGSSTTVELPAKPLSLGRAAENDLAYPSDPALSRHHLRIEPAGEGWAVRDCGSRNGTLVDGAPLTEPKRLTPGNRIYAGQLTIDVRDQLPGVVTFVSQESVGTKRSSTIITSLDEVLGRTN